MEGIRSETSCTSVEIDAKTLISDSGLVRWEFDHLLSNQQPFTKHQNKFGESSDWGRFWAAVPVKYFVIMDPEDHASSPAAACFF